MAVRKCKRQELGTPNQTTPQSHVQKEINVCVLPCGQLSFSSRNVQNLLPREWYSP